MVGQMLLACTMKKNQEQKKSLNILYERTGMHRQLEICHVIFSFIV